MAKKKRRVVRQPNGLPEADSSIDFEEALAEVETIVDKLESGELGLTESLQQYEIGVKRLKQCHALLQQAERRVTLLSGIDEDGNPITENFDPGDQRRDSSGSKAAATKKSLHGGGGAGSRDSVDDSPGLF